APLLGTVGIVLYMFTSSKQKQGLGSILLGFMALMTGMSLMSDSMAFLKSEQWFANLMVSFSNPILGVLAGAVLTGIIQSSSASVGILQSLCATGAVSFGTAIPIILGQNIGTCVTALISTVGANRNARRTALVHLYFNIVGVALFCILFYGLGAFIKWEFLSSTANAVDIAMVHTGFNIAATSVLLPMNKLLEKLAYLTIPAEPVHQEPVLLDERLLATPGVAVSRSYQVAGDMLAATSEAMRLSVELFRDYSEEKFQKICELEEETDNYEDSLGSYLVKLTGVELNPVDNRTLNAMLYTISDIERIADYALILAKTSKRMNENGVKFSDVAMQELEVLEKAVMHIVDSTAKAFAEADVEKAAKIEPQDEVISSLVKEIKARHVRRLRNGQCSVEYGLVLDDLLTSYQRSADHCSNIAVEMLQTAEDKLEAHEYLNALKAGDLEESARFSENLDDYRERYSFPEEN
ncbi:MAG: Na/Pi cotransporter family protein, partial [Oscillospiraceae bacterium]|nr:Na/Pi cotransporter family protein [Oscillospiraceae bacterium]